MSEIQESFLKELEHCLLNQYTASMMLDINGLVSLDGKVKKINHHLTPILIELDSGESISLDQMVAINGIFDQRYLGC